jgi:hypothetical protein
VPGTDRFDRIAHLESLDAPDVYLRVAVDPEELEAPSARCCDVRRDPRCRAQANEAA